MFAGWFIPLFCSVGSPVVPWNCGSVCWGITPSFSNLPWLLVSARQLRHTRAAGCVASGHLNTLPLSLHPPPPVAHKVLVALVHFPLSSEKPQCCCPGPGTFLSPVLWEKVKQAANLGWFLFSTPNFSAGVRWVHGEGPWTPWNAAANLVLSAWEMFTSDLQQRVQN